MRYEPLAGGVIDVAAGASPSTRTAVVVGSGKVRMASLRPASWIVPPFRLIGEINSMPSASRSGYTSDTV